MRLLVVNVINGLPALLGVLVGVFLFQAGLNGVLPLLIFLVALFALMRMGQKLLARNPVPGRILIELWILSGAAVVALTTMGLLWLTVSAPGYFGGNKERQDALAGALVGGITAYLATLWIKDIEEAKGPFWPSTMFKGGVETAYGRAPLAPPGDSDAWHAVNSDRFSRKEKQEKVEGWGFEARGKRAKILEEYIERRK